MPLKIACILVTYNPEATTLKQLINQLAHQVELIVIVDNSSLKFKVPITESKKIIILKNENQNGIAGAQNKALKYILNTNSKYVIFLDQDSEISNNFVAELAKSYIHLIKQDSHIGAIGGTPINKKTKTKYFHKVLFSTNDNKYDCTDILISSSLFTSINVLKKVGAMDKKLFIDFVDQEWCWRATHLHSLQLYISKDLTFQHQLGNGLFHFGPLLFVKCSPFRSYFVARNSLLLLRKKYVPLKWKIKTIIRLFFMPWIYLFQEKGTEHFKRIFLGIKNGLLNQ